MAAAPSRYRIAHAARVVNDGGVIAYPTEAVYGLGCDPLDADAVARILDLKGRSAGAGFILIAANVGQLDGYIEPLPPERMRSINATWPGPVTWIWPASPAVPDWITGGRDSVAVRVTAHETAAALCRLSGTALISTSANKSGGRPARTPAALRRYFGDRIDFILSGPLGGRERPTAIRDARTGEVIRDDSN